MYQNKWYRTEDPVDEPMHDLLFANFDVAIRVDEVNNEARVIKDRFQGEAGQSMAADMFKMKMFASGVTYEDFPVFTMVDNRNYRNTCIGYKDNGDLFEYLSPRYVE